MLVNKLSHVKISHISDPYKIKLAINENNFKRLRHIGNGLYEIEKGLMVVKNDLPIHVPFLILNYAKIRMLEFTQDYLQKFTEFKLQKIILSDTDSIMLSLGRQTLTECVREDKKEEHYNHCTDDSHIDTILQRRCCQKHFDFDFRVPGIFKLEMTSAHCVMALSSKTYLCLSDPEAIRISCKGAIKTAQVVNSAYHRFKNVLENQASEYCINRGFRFTDGRMMAYTIKKAIFNYFYIKRVCNKDNFCTTPLNLTINTIPKLYKCIKSD